MALSKADWVVAALDVLEREGLSAIAVEPLARRLGATKGSFYWHFGGRAELLDATLEHWERRDTDEVIAAIEAIADDAQARLEALLRHALADGEEPGAEAPLLAAAAANPRVGAVLDRVTAKRLAFLEGLYAELGLNSDSAARRAKIVYAFYLGICELRRTEARRDVELHADELEALLRESSRLLITAR